MPSVKSQKKRKVRVSAAAKESVLTRTDAGKVVEANAPQSPIFQQNADVKMAQENLVLATGRLDAKSIKVKALEVELGSERGALANLTVDWDGYYDVFVSTARIYCVTDEDAKGLGLLSSGVTTRSLAMPVSVAARWDARTGLLRIRVQRAPGLRTVRIEISADPITPSSWKELDGDGATAALPGFAPGIYWVRAAMVRARERSEFTTPVSVIVK